MGVLDETRDRIAEVCVERGIPADTPVTVRGLTPSEAIGDEVSSEFVIRRGKEVVIEAEVAGVRGQAFTDRAVSWRGSLGEVFALSLEEVSNRAVVVATLNAVASKLGIAEHVIHCRQEDPMRCGPELVARLAEGWPDVERVFLVGLQPAILKALVEHYGADHVRVVDRDAENIGAEKHGVTVQDGYEDISADIGWCDLMLVTGSSIVNGTLDELLEMSENCSKPLVFFGNTIAAVAAVADLQRLCPLGVS
jgi:uncharacterized protein (DUF4213/DUF364 family)